MHVTMSTEYTLLCPLLDVPQASESGGASAPRSSAAVPVPAGQAASAALEARGDGNLVLTTKNLHALRTLFNCAHRLADGLGPSWVHVVDVLNSLDRLLSSQSAATKVQDQLCAALQL